MVIEAASVAGMKEMTVGSGSGESVEVITGSKGWISSCMNRGKRLRVVVRADVDRAPKVFNNSCTKEDN